jgi:hypothetical protein
MQITQLLSPNMFCINKIISADLIFEIFDIALLSWSRSLKAGGVDKRSVKATPFPSSFGLKSDERAAKRKEVPIKTDTTPPPPPPKKKKKKEEKRKRKSLLHAGT